MSSMNIFVTVAVSNPDVVGELHVFASDNLVAFLKKKEELLAYIKKVYSLPGVCFMH